MHISHIISSLFQFRHHFWPSVLICFTQLDRISHQAWHFAHKTRLTCQIPCSAQMSLLFNMCLLSVPWLLVSLSACLGDFRLTPFVFWCAFFYFQHFTLVHKSLRAAKRRTEENCWNKFPQLTSRCASSRSWPLFLDWSIRAQSQVSTEIKAPVTHSEGRAIYLCFYDTPCSNLCVCVA